MWEVAVRRDTQFRFEQPGSWVWVKHLRPPETHKFRLGSYVRRRALRACGQKRHTCKLRTLSIPQHNLLESFELCTVWSKRPFHCRKSYMIWSSHFGTTWIRRIATSIIVTFLANSNQTVMTYVPCRLSAASTRTRKAVRRIRLLPI